MIATAKSIVDNIDFDKLDNIILSKMIEKYNFSVVDIYIILLFYGINAEAVIYHLSLNLISFSEYPVSLDNCSVVVFQFSKIISFGTSNSIANLSASVS